MWKSKFYGAVVLNRRVVLHAIDDCFSWLIPTQVAELAMDGTDLLAADLTSVDLDLSDSDAAFLRAALEWWDITSSCAENPKMYAAIGGGGRRASVEKGYY